MSSSRLVFYLFLYLNLTPWFDLSIFTEIYLISFLSYLIYLVLYLFGCLIKD